MRRFTAVSLFCGAGGLDMGFERAGFYTVWANDFDDDACQTHRLWSHATVVQGDIGKIKSEEIPDADIILGGFPCQGFSLSGPRKIDDSRNRLYLQYVRILHDKRPLAFVGENVKGLLTMGKGEVFKAILDDFSKQGYVVFYQLINAKNYGDDINYDFDNWTYNGDEVKDSTIVAKYKDLSSQLQRNNTQISHKIHLSTNINVPKLMKLSSIRRQSLTSHFSNPVTMFPFCDMFIIRNLASEIFKAFNFG